MNIASTNTATNTAAAAIMLTNNDDDGATILDDGLSTCDEDNNFNENSRNRTLTTSADAARQISEAKRYHWFTCSLLFITFFISVLISSVRIYVFPRQEQLSRLGAGNDTGTWNDIFGNGLEEKENALRLNQTLEYLIQTNAVVNSDVTLMKDIAEEDYIVSAQYGAAVWIAQYDKFRIAIPSPPSSSNSRKSSEEYQFLQRYALAVLFFATGGTETWVYKLNFLSGLHECDGWYDLFLMEEGSEEGFPFGVLCDGEPTYETEEEIAELEKDVWNGTRTVTAIVLPRKFISFKIKARHEPFLSSEYYPSHANKDDRHFAKHQLILTQTSLFRSNFVFPTLAMNNMWGSLPPELHHLRYLKTLFISENEMLMGEIPFQYGWLKHLEFCKSFVCI